MKRLLLIYLFAALLLGVFTTPATAQSGLSLQAQPYDVGIDGHYRPGHWTPLRLSVTQHGGEPRNVIYRWVHHDFDGDRIHAQRTGTLTPDTPTTVWLYAALRHESDDPWLVQVIEQDSDGEPGAVLEEIEIAARQPLGRAQSAIGILGNAPLGLEPYQHHYTRHERLEPIRGLSLASLPDRWHGLEALEAIVWTPEADAPTDPDVAAAQHEALRHWVQRGGHLIVMLPAVGETWTGSPLADLLPVQADQLRRVRRTAPDWLGEVDLSEQQVVDYLVFDGVAAREGSVLRRDAENDAVVVGARRGFGRVTVLGIDLTDSAITQQGLPSGRYPIWNDVLGQTGPVLEPRLAQQMVRDQEMANPDRRSTVELARFITPMVSMTGTAGPALLVAVFLFGLYWLLAGPIGFAYLKQRNAVRYAWLGFASVVLVFAVLSWGGAWLMQPRQPAIAHFSVVDLDASTDTARTRSWFSMYVPDFGRAQVSLAAGDATTGANLLSFPGLPLGLEPTTFLDPQSYALNAISPSSAHVPVRSTAKQGELHYMGPLHEQQGLAQTWEAASGDVRLEGNWPAGELTHDLPGALRDVLVVYCPGGTERPWVWRRDQWEPGQVLNLANRSGVFRLVERSRDYFEDRNLQNEGLLGVLLHHQTGQRHTDLEPWEVMASDNEIIQSIEMLSFFAMLPPPDVAPRERQLTRRTTAYQRHLGRSLDITPLTQQPRVLVIGHLPNASLPAPLTLNDQTVGSEGWTVVRMVYEIE